MSIMTRNARTVNLKSRTSNLRPITRPASHRFGEGILPTMPFEGEKPYTASDSIWVAENLSADPTDWRDYSEELDDRYEPSDHAGSFVGHNAVEPDADPAPQPETIPDHFRVHAHGPSVSCTSDPSAPFIEVMDAKSANGYKSRSHRCKACSGHHWKNITVPIRHQPGCPAITPTAGDDEWFLTDEQADTLYASERTPEEIAREEEETLAFLFGASVAKVAPVAPVAPNPRRPPVTIKSRIERKRGRVTIRIIGYGVQSSEIDFATLRGAGFTLEACSRASKRNEPSMTFRAELTEASERLARSMAS